MPRLKADLSTREFNLWRRILQWIKREDYGDWVDTDIAGFIHSGYARVVLTEKGEKLMGKFNSIPSFDEQKFLDSLELDWIKLAEKDANRWSGWDVFGFKSCYGKFRLNTYSGECVKAKKSSGQYNNGHKAWEDLPYNWVNGLERDSHFLGECPGIPKMYRQQLDTLLYQNLSKIVVKFRLPLSISKKQLMAGVAKDFSDLDYYGGVKVVRERIITLLEAVNELEAAGGGDITLATTYAQKTKEEK